MDKPESVTGSSQELGSVKQAVSFYGGRQDRRRVQMPFTEKPPSRAKELHIAKKEIGQFNENRRVAEYNRIQAQSELSSAKKTVKELTLQLEETKSKAMTQKLELETLKRSERHVDEGAMVVAERENHQYAEVMKELENVKRDLSKLKLDMASLLETKSRYEKETDASTSRIRSYSSSIESLKKEIEEANEEHVLVELARMEALREVGFIKAQRDAEASAFASTMQNTRKKMEEIAHEIDSSKELESKLAITTSDVDLLQNELMLVKAMGESFKKTEISGEAEPGELEAAKKELASIKEEGFQLMASMDIIRTELKHVTDENARLRKIERKTESSVQNLNTKLLRANSKLESITAAEEKANAIVSNLRSSLEQITSEAEAAKTEKELITAQAAKITTETQKMETEIDLAEERLRVAVKELEEVKASEALALESLKDVSEKTMKDRATASQYNSTITISNFEYQYLSGRALGVEEIADKKVAAAEAWIEALKASEKEILMKTEITLKETRELKIAAEQQELQNQEGESPKFRQQHRDRPRKSTKVQLDDSMPRKSIKEYAKTPFARRGAPRRPSSPGARHLNRSGSITLKKKTKVVPNLGKLFGGKESENNI